VAEVPSGLSLTPPRETCKVARRYSDRAVMSPPEDGSKVIKYCKCEMISYEDQHRIPVTLFDTQAKPLEGILFVPPSTT
jgi:hypothetical protein